MALVLSRLGFPPIGRHRRFVTAIAIDSVGSGAWIPVAMLYFVAVTPLSLVQVGLAMSIGSLVAAPLTLVVGSLVDRYGSKRVLLAGNVIECLGFAAFPFAHNVPAVTLVIAVTSSGQTAFWGSFGPLIAAITEPGERELWFGFTAALKNAGFAIGGLVAGAVVTIGTTVAYQSVVVINAVSFVAAFVLMLGVRTRQGATATHEVIGGGWRTVLRDRGYRWVLGANLGYAMMCMALNVAIPVYLVHMLGLPGWTSGAVFVINTVMIGVGQGLVVRAMTGRTRSRIIMLAAGFTVMSYLMLIGVAHLAEPVAVGLALLVAVVYTLGESVAGPVLSTLAAESPPVRLRGRFMAAYQMTWTVATTIAPLLYSWLLGRGPAAAWLAMTAITVAGAACCVPMHRLLPLASRPVTNEVVGDEPLVDVDTSAATASVDPS